MKKSELRQLIKEEISKVLKEEQPRYNKGEIITLVTRRGDNNGEVTVDSVYNSTIIGYLKAQGPTPIKVKIVQAEDGDGYDVYDMSDNTRKKPLQIRNNHKILPKK